ncbi:MAG: ABC transporter substrate-binding protein [Clostridium sp.]|nr:MAG: ABC transporter substrate-binding protein [Clostridium sp.]
MISFNQTQKPETITELEGKLSEGIQNKSIRTAGYGYIGINASKVPSVNVRQAIMHAINTQECVEYYKNTAQAIYRPMSLSSWAYPKDATPYYPYIGGAIPEDLSVVNPYYADFVNNKGYSAGQVMSEADQKEFITSLVEEAGYTLNGSGIYQNGSNVCKYVFTIAGEETDHPAWNAMWHAQEVLNKYGFQITCQTDANALKKLSTGDLTVWAAAWGSTIDPDMYQVYHKDSKATSVFKLGI